MLKPVNQEEEFLTLGKNAYEEICGYNAKIFKSVCQIPADVINDGIGGIPLDIRKRYDFAEVKFQSDPLGIEILYDDDNDKIGIEFSLNPWSPDFIWKYKDPEGEDATYRHKVFKDVGIDAYLISFMEAHPYAVYFTQRLAETMPDITEWLDKQIEILKVTADD